MQCGCAEGIVRFGLRTNVQAQDEDADAYVYEYEYEYGIRQDNSRLLISV